MLWEADGSMQRAVPRPAMRDGWKCVRTGVGLKNWTVRAGEEPSGKFGERSSSAHRQVDEQPTKRSKKNDDKSAVAMLKKNDWREIVRQPVVNLDRSHERSERPDNNLDIHHELKRGPVGRRSSNARQLGCVFHDMKPPKSLLRKSSDMRKPIQRVKFTKGYSASH